MLWLSLAVLSRFLYACCNVADSHFSRCMFKSGLSQNFIVQLYYLVFSVFMFAWLQPAWPSSSAWLWIFVAAFFQGFYLIPYFSALKAADSSVVASLFTLGRALTPVMAFLLIGEQLSVWGYIGFVVVVGGALYHSYVPDLKNFNVRAAVLMGLSGLMTAVYAVASKAVFDKIGLVDGFAFITGLSCLLSVLIFAVPSLRRTIKADFVQPRRQWGFFFLIFCLSVFANFTFFYSLSLTQPTNVAMIGQAQPFFVLLVSFGLYKALGIKTQENFSAAAVKQKSVGFLIMAAGFLLSLLPAFGKG